MTPVPKRAIEPEGRLEARHSASFVTFQKPCEEALSDLSAEYNKLADRIEAAWQENAELKDAIRMARSFATHNAERHTGFVHIGRILANAIREED